MLNDWAAEAGGIKGGSGIVGRLCRATASYVLCCGFDPCRQRPRSVAVDSCPKQSCWLINQLGNSSKNGSGVLTISRLRSVDLWADRQVQKRAQCTVNAQGTHWKLNTLPVRSFEHVLARTSVSAHRGASRARAKPMFTCEPPVIFSTPKVTSPD